MTAVVTGVTAALIGAMIGGGRVLGVPAVMVYSGENAFIVDFQRGLERDVRNPYVQVFSPTADVPIASPDGETRLWLAYTGDDTFITQHYDLNHRLPDGTVRTIMGNVNRDVLMWAQGGRTLLFYVGEAVSERMLYSYNVQTGALAPVLAGDIAGCTDAYCAFLHATYADDNTLSERALYVLSRADLSVRRVAHTTQPPAEIRVGWSTDGTRLAYSLPEGDDVFSIYTYDVPRNRVTHLERIAGLERVQWLNWSYDGEWLLFTAPTRARTFNIYAHSTTNPHRRLTDMTARLHGDAAYIYPRWSPAAPRAAFRYTQDNELNLFMANAPDGALQQITHMQGADYMTVSWSPGGEWLAAGVRQRGRCDVRVINPRTTSETFKLDFTRHKAICDVSFQTTWYMP